MFSLPEDSAKLLSYLRNLSTDSTELRITAYSQALSLLKDDLPSLLIFQDYLSISHDRIDPDELEHLYYYLKVKFRAHKAYWTGYIRYVVSVRGKNFENTFNKVLEYLKVKVFEGRDELIKEMLLEKQAIRKEILGCDENSERTADGSSKKAAECSGKEDDWDKENMANRENRMANKESRMTNRENLMENKESLMPNKENRDNDGSNNSNKMGAMEKKQPLEVEEENLGITLMDMSTMTLRPSRKEKPTDYAIKGTELKTIKYKNADLLIINRIGKGGYSVVYRVIMDNEVYALKQIRADEESIHVYEEEINLLKRLSKSDLVIKMIDYEIAKDTVNIVLECGEIDLAQLLKRGGIDEFYIKYLWGSILKIVSFIHLNRIIHRDIKPANFVLVKGRLKLIDFGISRSIRADTTSILNNEKAGTLNYIAPEQCIKRKVGRAADMWAAGCILYNMIYKKNIHCCKDWIDVVKFMSDEKAIEYPDANALAISAMKQCLVYDPKERKSAKELLNHPYLKTED